MLRSVHRDVCRERLASGVVCDVAEGDDGTDEQRLPGLPFLAKGGLGGVEVSVEGSHDR